jgi:hypothetical protein
LSLLKSILDAPAQLVEAVVEAERLLPVAFVRNDRLATAFMELAAQFGAAPGAAASQNVHDATDDAAIICSLYAAHIPRQVRFDPLPLIIGHSPLPKTNQDRIVAAKN